MRRRKATSYHATGTHWRQYKAYGRRSAPYRAQTLGAGEESGQGPARSLSVEADLQPSGATLNCIK